MDAIVGVVGRPHGIRGEVSVEVRTDEPERRFAVGSTLRPEPSSHRALTVAAARPHGDRLLVLFEEVPDRTTAESLRGANLLVDVEPGDQPDHPEEFYDRQLVGLDVRSAGERVGTVTDVLHRPTQDLLVIRTVADHEVLVPFVSALVPEVDPEAGWLTVADLPGLLAPDGAEEG